MKTKKINNESPLLKKHIQKDRFKPIVMYTAVFWLLALIIYGGFFWFNNRSLVNWNDGFTQHCTVLTYYGNYLRTIIRNILIEHNFTVPMFDFSIGYGYDIISTFNYYGIGDPLNLLSVIVPARFTEYLYGFLIIFRMYLSGLFFTLYMRTKNSDSTSLFIGAISYALCGFALSGGVRHPFFLTGMMYFPLVLLGIDKVFEKKSPVLYILSVAFAVVTNFYLGYVICIFMIIYAVIKYITEYLHKGIKFFAATVGKFALFSVNAFLISAIFFLPVAKNILSVERLNTDYVIPKVYESGYLDSLIGYFTNASDTNYWVIIGFSGVTVLCIFTALINFKKNKITVVSLILSIIMLAFPIFGHIFNGFAYVTNRWCWVIAFIGCSAVVMNFRDIFEMPKKDKLKLFALSGVYFLTVSCIAKSRTELTFMMIAVLFITLGLSFANQAGIIGKKAAVRAVSCLAVFSIIMQSVYLFSLPESGFVNEFCVKDKVFEYMVEKTASDAVKQVDRSDEFFRYDNYYINSCNDSVLNNMNSTSFYFSVNNPYISKFIKEQAYNIIYEQRYCNNDSRVILQYLTGSKYTVNNQPVGKDLFYSETARITYDNEIGIKDDNSDIFGFRGVRNITGDPFNLFIISETENYLPMGYTYDSVIGRKEYEAMTPAERQNVLLQCAVTDDTDALPEADIDTSSLIQTDINGLIKDTDGIKIEGNKITVTDTSAVLTIKVPVKNNSEIYLYWQGMGFTPINKYTVLEDRIEELKNGGIKEELTTALSEDGDGGNISDAEIMQKAAQRIDKYNIRRFNRNKKYSSDAASAKVKACFGNAESTGAEIQYYTPDAPFYSGYNTYLMNIGYIPEQGFIGKLEEQTVSVSFSEKGIYSFEKLDICCQSLDNIIGYTEDRKADIFENVVTEDNKVSGTVSLSEPKLLATQIPFSEGWSVKVDGKDEKLCNVNTMFCGVMLSPGEHTVEFNYVTPNAGISLAMTVSGIVLLAAAAVTDCLLKKKKTK